MTTKNKTATVLVEFDFEQDINQKISNIVEPFEYLKESIYEMPFYESKQKKFYI